MVARGPLPRPPFPTTWFRPFLMGFAPTPIVDSARTVMCAGVPSTAKEKGRPCLIHGGEHADNYSGDTIPRPMLHRTRDNLGGNGWQPTH